jgi:glycosyltransferase A (GT-A) superfamily protein (DUF2064 family)
VRPALLVLVDQTAAGGDDGALTATLELARQVGGVGRVLLFHPLEAEPDLTTRALGFRLWPLEGDTPAERYANAFRQAGELGYEGAVAIGLDATGCPPGRLAEAAGLLEEHQGVVAPGPTGGIGLLGLQRPEPTLFPPGEVPGYDELLKRAKQQLVRLRELEAVPAPPD